MKKPLYLACFLAVVSALAGGLLAVVNQVTAEKIAANAMGEVMKSLEEIFPGTNYNEVEFTDETGLVTGAFEAEGQGYLFQVESNGFKDVIKFVVAMDNDSNIVGYDVIAISETSGIGSRVAEDDFKNTVIGKTTGDKIDTLAGATISSTAVVKGLDAAKAVYATVSGNAAPAPSTPAEPEEPKAAYTVVEKTADGAMTTVVVTAKGFQGDNEYTVVVDTDKKEIVSVEMTAFNDTPGVGDQVNEEYLEGFKGLDSEDAIADVDVVASATFTSNSAIEAVKGAFAEAFTAEGEAEVEEEAAPAVSTEGVELKGTEGSLNTYTVAVKGFQGENAYEIVIDTEKNEVVSVAMTEFNDTPGIGDQVDEEYLAGFAGLHSDDAIASVDVKASATFTSNSAIEAVRKAFAASQE